MPSIAELTGYRIPPKPQKRKRRGRGPGWIPIGAHRLRTGDRLRIPHRPGEEAIVSAVVALPDAYLWIDLGSGKGFETHPQDRVFVWNPRPPRRETR